MCVCVKIEIYDVNCRYEKIVYLHYKFWEICVFCENVQLNWRLTVRIFSWISSRLAIGITIFGMESTVRLCILNLTAKQSRPRAKFEFSVQIQFKWQSKTFSWFFYRHLFNLQFVISKVWQCDYDFCFWSFGDMWCVWMNLDVWPIIMVNHFLLPFAFCGCIWKWVWPIESH